MGGFGNLQIGQRVGLDLLVLDLQTGKTRTSDPFLTLTLGDGSGQIAAKWWRRDNDGSIKVGAAYYVTGTYGEYQGVPQLTIDSAKPSDRPAEDFLPRSVHSPETVSAAFDCYIAMIHDVLLHHAVATILQRWQDKFYTAPAASTNHHARIGGLADHTLAMLHEWEALHPVLEQFYPGMVDNDVMIAAIVIHDLGKCIEIEAKPGFPYSTEGNMLGHISIGLIAVWEALGAAVDTDKGQRLLNCLLAHHGKLELGSPVEARCPEALVLHQIDMLDSRLGMYSALVAKGVNKDGWTERDKNLGAMRGPLRPQTEE
jgi:3'-5' exoribonuclease